MKKLILISFFILSLLIVGSISTLFIYPERTQNFVLDTLNLKNFVNKKVKNLISNKLNDENLNVDIETINFLKFDWPNIAKIKLNNVYIYSIKEKMKSKIRLIELGFSFDKLITNFFLNDNDLQFSYIKFQDLSLNARIKKDEFSPGPLLKIFSLFNENNFQAQPSLKKILENKIVIGKINFLLRYNVNPEKEEILQIKCENVIMSNSIHKSRNLDMDCDIGKNNLFSLKANLDKNFNNFSGKIKNINSNFLLSNWLNENFNFLKTNFYSQLNGSYSIKTTKDFSIQSVNFVSDESTVVLKNTNYGKGLKTKLSGEVFWDKRKNFLRFSDIILGGYIAVSGEIDLMSQIGSSNFSIKKILVDDAKNFLNEFFNYYDFPLESYFHKISNKLRRGHLTTISINVKFSLFEKFTIEEINGSSNFSNIRLEYNDKFFKMLLSTISGDFDFIIKPQELNDSLINVKLSATNGTMLLNNNFQYKFSRASLNGKYFNNDFLISKADFFKNTDLEYTFQNIKIGKDVLHIASAKYIKEKKAQYIFSDITVNNMNVTKSNLKIKNNGELSKYVKSKFGIEMNGNPDLDVFLSGNLKNFNFNLKLDSNLNDTYLKIDYLDLIKNKNITSDIKLEILMIKGEIIFLKNIHLRIENKTYEIGFVDFKMKNKNKFLIKNIKTPDTNIDELIILNNSDNLNIKASGKEIDLSSINKNLRSKSNFDKDIILDLTADLIKLNSKISLTGNLKGEIKSSLFKSVAYGKILLGGSSLLDNGKFEIYSDSKISRLEGLGLVGGAETKINLQKKLNNYPSLMFDTSNGGKLLSALGFTRNIKSGDMKININFLNDEYDHYEGRIKSKKFSITNAPGIINSLSILSFSGIRSIITGEGVFFDKGEVNINVKNKNFNFDKLYLTSESLGIAARGNLNLEKNTIHMTGSVAPIQLISKILSVVPAVGELLTGLKKEGLFAGQFEMRGQIENPEIKLNTLSFAPGILRELFSEDWLDNNNFFMNRALD